jgi:hypothetical protein
MPEWHWGPRGVSIEGSQLLWFDELGPVAFASGGASTQTFADFLEHGPAVDGVPDDVVTELTAAVREAAG